MVWAIRREAARSSSTSSRVSGARSPRRAMRSAVPWMLVSGVRSSWASSEVRRCSDLIADDTLSRRVSRVPAKALISFVGGPSAKRRPRSCSLQSDAVAAISATGCSARRTVHVAIPAAAAVARAPVTSDTIRASRSDSS